MAPEVFENKPYNEKADIYSFGVMLWEIICRKAPYANMTPYQIMYKVMKGGRPDETLIPQDAPLELVKIMQQCWDTQQEKRPSSAKISELLGNLYHKD
jgi:serine/threonine protein kinase